jgi:F-type H+-transporting ATPase subunit c
LPVVTEPVTTEPVITGGGDNESEPDPDGILITEDVEITVETVDIQEIMGILSTILI